MHLDVATLQLMGAIAIAISGAVLVLGWLQMRREPALLWWAAANLFYAAGVGVLGITGIGTYVGVAIVGSVLINAPPSLLWAGVRAFNGHPIWPAALTAGAGLAVASGVLLIVAPAQEYALAAGFAGWIVFLLPTLWELSRGASLGLPARWPLFALLALHLFIYVGGLFDTFDGGLFAGNFIRIGSWFGLILFEGVLYAMGSAISFLMIAKEKAERDYHRQASLDGLTGTANRREFLGRAAALMAGRRKDDKPLALLLVDIDRFKQVNDNFGHAMGDRVLAEFGAVTQRVLRPLDVVGRLGGDEFAVLLPGRDPAAAFAVAEKVRHAFADACRHVDGQAVGASVSIGIAAAIAGDDQPETIIARADRALYDAKSLGRNRCTMSPEAADAAKSEVVVRVA
jgi:diguanylate cyclase (GGDEF)-like protein